LLPKLLDMIELLGIGIAIVIGPAVGNALMEAIAALAAIRWPALSLFVSAGFDEGAGGSTW
jgi:hypothetical protein